MLTPLFCCNFCKCGFVSIICFDPVNKSQKAERELPVSSHQLIFLLMKWDSFLKIHLKKQGIFKKPFICITLIKCWVSWLMTPHDWLKLEIDWKKTNGWTLSDCKSFALPLSYNRYPFVTLRIPSTTCRVESLIRSKVKRGLVAFILRMEDSLWPN